MSRAGIPAGLVDAGLFVLALEPVITFRQLRVGPVAQQGDVHHLVDPAGRLPGVTVIVLPGDHMQHQAVLESALDFERELTWCTVIFRAAAARHDPRPGLLQD